MSERSPSKRRFTALLISGALASKLLGFGREILMANVVGTTLVADGFRGALTAAAIPFAFLQNESVPAILIPMHREALDKGHGPRHLGALTIVLSLIAISLTVAIEALGEVWVNAIVGGFTSEARDLTLEFMRIAALGMPASVVLNVLAAGEIALGRARLTNIRASLLNISMLFGIAVLVMTGYVQALAWSFSIAFNAMAAWGLLSLWREGVLRFAGLTPSLLWSVGKQFFIRLRPLFALPFAEQANVWVERLVASRLTTGAVASLDYARTLTESALLLISQPVGMAVLSSHPPKDQASQLEAIARPLLALALPASAFVLVFASDIVRLVFFRGAFGEEAVLLTSQTLRGIAVGLWAATLAWILIRILNGSGRNALAALIIISAYAVNIAVNLLTAHLGAGGASGMLLLGFGESARSLVLLAAVVFVLEGRRRIARLILLALLPAALMALLGWQIQSVVVGTIPRLAAGVLAYGLCVAFAVGLLMPTMYVSFLDRVLKTLRIKGDPP